MKYAVEMGSGAVIYIPSFMKTGSNIQKLIWWDMQTHRNHGDGISFYVWPTFLILKKNRLMRSLCCLCVCEYRRIAIWWMNVGLEIILKYTKYGSTALPLS
jgi:hypothetical protein